MDRQPGDGSGAGEEPAGGPGLPGGATPSAGLPASTAGAEPHGAAPDPGPSADDSAASGPGDGTPGPGAPSDPDPGAESDGPSAPSRRGRPIRAWRGSRRAGCGIRRRRRRPWRPRLRARRGRAGGARAVRGGRSWGRCGRRRRWSRGACAAKLGLIRAAIREDDDGLGGGYHGDLPDEWSKSLTTEVALALAMSPVSAEKLMQTAWDLGALLPGIGALLEDGTLTYPKARAVSDALELLGEEDKAKAEAMIAPRLAREDVRAGRQDRRAGRDHGRPGPGGADPGARGAEPGAGDPEAGAVGRGEPVRLRPAAGRDPGRARRDVRPRAAVQGLGGVPRGVHGPAPGDGLPGLDQQVSAEARIAAGPPDVGPGRAGGERVPGRAGAGRPGRARAGRQRRVGLPVRRVRRQVRAPRRRPRRRWPRRTTTAPRTGPGRPGDGRRGGPGGGQPPAPTSPPASQRTAAVGHPPSPQSAAPPPPHRRHRRRGPRRPHPRPRPSRST